MIDMHNYLISIGNVGTNEYYFQTVSQAYGDSRSSSDSHISTPNSIDPELKRPGTIYPYSKNSHFLFQFYRVLEVKKKFPPNDLRLLNIIIEIQVPQHFNRPVKRHLDASSSSTNGNPGSLKF